MTNLAYIQWKLMNFSDFDIYGLYTVLKARADTFIVEQKSPYQELDGLDAQSRHVIGRAEDAIAAYLRIVPPGGKYPEIAIDRVLINKTYRGQGLGRELTQRGIEHARQVYPGIAIRISAQNNLENFYMSYGFKTISEPYDDVGVMHIDMVLQAA
jgi:ElaA protein